MVHFSDLLQGLKPASAPFRGRLGVGVSGGGDSLALLLLLLKAGWSQANLLALHVDHAKRVESPDDARFVAEFAQRHGVPLQQGCLDAALTANASSAELRDWRYDELWRLAKANDCQALAVAHNADDQRETRLLAMLRGAGLHGLAGMREWQGQIWRPLLTVTRDDLRDFLLAQGERWREDRSNLDFGSLRARLRHVVLPAVARPISDSEALRIQVLQDEDNLLEHLARSAQNCLQNDCLDLQAFAQIEPPLQRRLLRQWLGDPALQIERIEALRIALIAPPPSRNRLLEMGQKISVEIGAKLARKK